MGPSAVALLTHQLVLHQETMGQLDIGKPVTPFKQRAGFSWFLFPVTVASAQGWLLVNVDFGYCDLVKSVSAADIEWSVLDTIELHLPDDRERDNVSVSFNPADISWHSGGRMSEHVAQRYQQALKQISQCNDFFDAEDKIEQLNNIPLAIGGRRFSPIEGLEGVLLELADNFSHYIETTPWWKAWWHAKIDHQPWLGQDFWRQ